jgi:hypothetical protein
VRIESDGEALRAAATASEESVRLIVMWVGPEEDIVMCWVVRLGFREKTE